MTKLSQLKIDPEFQNQINPPSFEETHQLELNILKEERVLNPIITWNGYIVDGHTRYQILRKYPFIPFEVIEKEFSSRYEALVWICKNQLGRRNLTPEQKKFLIGKQAEAEKQIKSFHGNQYTLASESGLVQNEPDRTKHGSRSKVAAEHGTSESYVYRAEQFAKGVEAAEEAVPGAQKEILSGKIRASDREISSIAKVPKEKRPEVVAELRKPKGERDSSITDSYSSPSKDNEFITTFKQDIQGHKKGLNKEEKQNLKDAVKSIYSPRRLADGEAMMCEIQGAQEDFVRRWEMCFREYPDILTEPKNSIIKQYIKLFEMDGIKLTFEDDVFEYIVDKAVEYKLGARGLRSIVETIMMDVMFEIPSENKKEYKVTLDYAKMQLEKANMARLQTA